MSISHESGVLSPRARIPLTSPLQERPALTGAACCLVSALAYTAADICLRQLSRLGSDPVWTVCNKELVTVLIVGPWLLWQAARRRPALPTGSTLLRLIAVGLLIQVAGNLSTQWALGIVGLAVTIPAVFGVMITSSAVLGWFLLGERVSLRSMAAMALLVASLVLLGVGAEAAGRSIAAQTEVTSDPLLVALAVAAACLAGAVYSLLSVVIRHSVTQTTLPSAIALLITLMGVVSLGPLSLARLGPRQMLATPAEQGVLMAAAGIFNLVGFFALIHGLQRTTVVHANVLNASQVALVAVAGMVIFREPLNPWLVLGVSLTVFGILWIDRPAEGELRVDQHI